MKLAPLLLEYYGGLPPVLRDAQEITNWIEETSSEYVDAEVIEEYFAGCKAVLKRVPVDSIRPGNDEHHMRDPKKENRYFKMKGDMPPIVVRDGVIEDGNHRYRVALRKGMREIWVYEVVDADI